MRKHFSFDAITPQHHSSYRACAVGLKVLNSSEFHRKKNELRTPKVAGSFTAGFRNTKFPLGRHATEFFS
jgi:hypothetical protein